MLRCFIKLFLFYFIIIFQQNNVHKYTGYFQMIPEVGISVFLFSIEIRFQSLYCNDYCASNIIEENITMQYNMDY